MRRYLITLHQNIWSSLTRDEGQGLTEYALILALIAIVAIAALTLLGHKADIQPSNRRLDCAAPKVPAGCRSNA
jgi:Flp pilus assembly pilin Flp